MKSSRRKSNCRAITETGARATSANFGHLPSRNPPSITLLAREPERKAFAWIASRENRLPPVATIEGIDAANKAYREESDQPRHRGHGEVRPGSHSAPDGCDAPLLEDVLPLRGVRPRVLPARRGAGG